MDSWDVQIHYFFLCPTHVGFRNNIHFRIHHVLVGSRLVMVDEMTSVELGEKAPYCVDLWWRVVWFRLVKKIFALRLLERGLEQQKQHCFFPSYFGKWECGNQME